MFGIGWTEMLVIGVVALIVIGPKDLPVVMHRIGKVVGSIRRMGTEFQREINRSTGLDQITDIRKSITEPLKQTAAEIRSEFNKTLPSGQVVPSGAIKPKDPKIESVVDEIHANLEMVAPEPVVPPPAPKPEKAKPVESPAPVEAIAPVKPKKPRAKAAPKPKAETETLFTTAAAAAPAAEAKSEAAPAKKPAAPRKPRTPKPKLDG